MDEKENLTRLTLSQLVTKFASQQWGLFQSERHLILKDYLAVGKQLLKAKAFLVHRTYHRMHE